MTDLEVAKKVVNDLFGKQVQAQTIQEIDQRLFVAHSLIDSVLRNNTGKGGLAEQWEPMLEAIEEQLDDLRNKIAVAKP